MKTRWLITLSLLTLLPLAAGCGSGSSAEFRFSERTDELVPPARDAVKDAVLSSFGTPENLVAWLRFPVDYGNYNGEVQEVIPDPVGGSFRVDLAAAEGTLAGELDDDNGFDPADLAGAGLLWTSGANVGRAVEAEDGRLIPVYYEVTGYDAERQMLQVRSKLKEAGVDTRGVDLTEIGPIEASRGDQFTIVGNRLQHGKELYLTHCMHCHGVTGDGNGPTAKYLNPLPRDYRLGIFKFTSTEKGDGSKPKRDDLKRVIEKGIPGTYMPSFVLLQGQDLDDIVEYVRWLAIRGEYEKRLVDDLASSDWTNEKFAERVAAIEDLDIEDAFTAMQEEYQSTLAEWEAGGKTGRQPSPPSRPSAAEVVNAELEAYLTEDFPSVRDDVATDIADSWARAEDEDNIVLPETGRETALTSLADEVSGWLNDYGRSLQFGTFESLKMTEQTVEGQEQPQQVATLTGKFEQQLDSSLADRQMLWISGPFKGQKFTIKTFRLRNREFTLEPPVSEAQSPQPGDRFVVARELPDGLAYVVTNGADLDAYINPIRPDEEGNVAAGGAEEVRALVLADSIQRGRVLYLSTTAKCASCHGPQGRGNGFQVEAFQDIPGTQDKFPEPGLYDVWHNPIQPRDLTRGIYRGGRRPIDIYRRISAGIKGTPMPAFGGTVLNDREIWDLVNYVYSVPFESRTRPVPADEQPDKSLAATAAMTPSSE